MYRQKEETQRRRRTSKEDRWIGSFHTNCEYGHPMSSLEVALIS